MCTFSMEELEKMVSDDYSWIKVKEFHWPDYLPLEEDAYEALSRHHIKETKFLIKRIKELAGDLLARDSVY